MGVRRERAEIRANIRSIRRLTLLVNGYALREQAGTSRAGGSGSGDTRLG
jgi:hypothetical protein